MRYLDLLERDDRERWLRQLHQSIGRGLHQDVGSIRNPGESNLPERYINANVKLFAGVSDLLGKSLELFVKLGSTPSFFLFGLKLLFVAKAMSSFPVAGLIEGHIGSFAIKLHIFGFALTDHDGILQVEMKNDD